MKTFHVISTAMGEIHLNGETLEQAKSDLFDGWTNSGKKTIVERTYELVETKHHEVDTDYGEEDDSPERRYQEGYEDGWADAVESNEHYNGSGEIK